MSDRATARQTPATQPGKACHTARGAHGGGTAYTQMAAVSNRCIVIPPITGHTQKSNVKQ